MNLKTALQSHTNIEKEIALLSYNGNLYIMTTACCDITQNDSKKNTFN